MQLGEKARAALHAQAAIEGVSPGELAARWLKDAARNVLAKHITEIDKESAGNVVLFQRKPNQALKRAAVNANERQPEHC